MSTDRNTRLQKQKCQQISFAHIVQTDMGYFENFPKFMYLYQSNFKSKEKKPFKEVNIGKSTEKAALFQIAMCLMKELTIEAAQKCVALV